MDPVVFGITTKPCIHKFVTDHLNNSGRVLNWYHKSAVIYKYKGELGPIHFESYSDFTVNSCDYFLSQPGLFSAKLTPELVYKI